MVTVKRFTTLPERSVKTPYASSVPLKYSRRSRAGFSIA